ncbi:MAG: alkaline phosphatase family protein [Saprospiraceae bacterium]
MNLISKKNLVFLCFLLAIFQTQFIYSNSRKVLLIGIDGLRSDVVIKAKTPNLKFLANNGFGTFESYHQDITMSAPSWISILSGVYHNKHGVKNNTFSNSHYSNYPMICNLAKQINPKLKFGMYMEWANFRNNIEQKGWDQIISGDLAHSNKTTRECKDWISNSDLDFYFVYYGECDITGHKTGFSPYNPFYVRSVEHIDKQIGKIIASLKSRKNYDDEDWLILITTDHGGKMIGHGGLSTSERKMIWLAYSDRIKIKYLPGLDCGNLNLPNNLPMSNCNRTCPIQTDITATALNHLLYGEDCYTLDCFNSWNLDGKSWLSDMGLNSCKENKSSIVCCE